MTCSDACIVTALLRPSRHRKKHINNFMENLNVHWHHAREPPDHTSNMKALDNIYRSITIFGGIIVYCQEWVVLAIPLLVNVIWNIQHRSHYMIVQSVQGNKKIYIFITTAKVSTLRWAKKPPLSALWGHYFTWFYRLTTFRVSSFGRNLAFFHHSVFSFLFV